MQNSHLGTIHGQLWLLNTAYRVHGAATNVRYLEHAVCIAGARKENIQGSILQIHLPGKYIQPMHALLRSMFYSLYFFMVRRVACLQAGSQTFQPDQIAV